MKVVRVTHLIHSCLRLARLLLLTAAAALPALPQHALAAVFEDGFEAALWSGATAGTFTREAPGRTGGLAVKAVRQGTPQYLSSAPIAINPNNAYRVGVWIKSALPDSIPDISVNVLQLRADGSAIGWAPQDRMGAIRTGGTQNWTRHTVTLPRLHSATATVRLSLRLEAGSAGSVWFDDVLIESINQLGNPGFEAGLWRETNGAWVPDATEAHAGRFSAKALLSAEGRFLASAPMAVDDYRGYLLSGWVKTASTLPADVISVSVKVLQLDANGQALDWVTLNNSPKLASAAGNTPWTHFSVTLPPLRKGTASLKIHLVTHATTAFVSRPGSAWFDDLVLAPVYRDNFLWGVGGHTERTNNQVYPRSQIDLQLDKAAALGGSIYRVNLTPGYDKATGEYLWGYLDQLVDAAIQRGQKVCLVLFDGESEILAPENTAYYAARARDIATRYRGKVAYYQLSNELDGMLMRSKDFDGTQRSHYDLEKYAKVRDWLAAVSAAVREADPYARRVLNISWTHLAFLDMLNADGVQWDVNALDWYWPTGTMMAVLQRLQGYRQKEILVTEFNLKDGTLTASEEAQKDFIVNGARETYYRAPSKVTGFIVYELFDEENHETAVESRYGLVRYTPGLPGTSGPDKAAYGAMQALIRDMPR